ncbi:MAG: sugar-binding protein [Armatimonadota bacterium]|nr:sugar-binding protein [Armatimonadota bacterium]
MRYAVGFLVAIVFSYQHLFGAEIGARSVPLITIPFVEKGPELKGLLSDPLWQKGAKLTGFKSIKDGKPVAFDTTAYILYDPVNLYIGVRCSELYIDQIFAEIKEHDGEVWRDDCVEILLDTNHGHRTAYHIAVNSKGVVSDARRIFDDRADTKWESECAVKADYDKGFWTLEIAIPFKALGVKPVAGLMWGLNICRERMVSPREYSAWANTPGGFVRPDNFGHVVLGGDSSGIRLVTWGNLDTDNLYGGENVLKCEITNPHSQAESASATLVSKINGKTSILAKGSITIPPSATKELSLEYTPAGDPKEIFELRVDLNGSLAMLATHPSTAIPPAPRVWQMDDALFEPLLSKTPPGEQKNGAIYWFHSGNAAELRAFAKEFGVRYSLEEAYKELADYKLMPIVQPHVVAAEPLKSMVAKYHFKVLVEPEWRGAVSKGAQAIGGKPYIFDPKSKDAYLETLKSSIEQAREYIWGVYSWDEMHEQALGQPLELKLQMPDSSLVKEIDEEVKKKFGYGKFGLPDTSKESDPFCWIAYRKWINHKLLEWQKEIYETTKKLAPEIQVVSFDPVAGHKPYELDAIGPFVDIVTHQLYPSGNPNRQEFGFVTKLVADLTGKPVWPCTHVENYAYSTTAEETRELMSQVMRNGGKGFHLYIPDVQGGRAPSGDTKLSKYGCPERFRAIMEIVRMASEMNEVAVPNDPDCAILYSEDHYQSFTAPSYIFPNEPEYAYTFLGPVARTWFKFINDNMVADGRANLKAWKAVFIPGAKYERPEVVKALADYVRDGGVLVCGDPEAFTWAPDGSSLADLRKELLGVDVGPSVEQTEILITDDTSYARLKGLKLSVGGSAFKLTVGNNVKVVATFADGSPAIIEHRFGKGKVIFFASNPFAEKTVGDQAWKDFFKALAENLGLKTGRDIWRFKFPNLKTVYQSDPEGVCLTGNYIRWQQERPINVKNAAVKGTYSYMVPPDEVADEAGEILIEFGKGNLTDRRLAPILTKKVLHPRNFIVTWRKTDQTAVTFDFGKPFSLKRLHLWYSDQLPEMIVEGSEDGKNWSTLASNPKQNPTEDVLDVSLDLPSDTPYRFVRLSFGKRDPGAKMTLVECEIWANPEKDG